MKRLYTCIRQEGNSVVWETYNRVRDVMGWINKCGVDVHNHEATAGQLIHQCANGDWAMILLNGKPMSLKHDVIPFFPTNVPLEDSNADD
jgi:hypothetical protein